MEEELLEQIKNRFSADGYVQRRKRIWVSIESEKLVDLCKFAKEKGFLHISAISATDWPEDGEFELTYHTWSYEEKVLLTIKTRISRDNPEIESVYPIWGESAQIHERELHELFGVTFKGNPNLSPLFLEDWQGPPPFRKDFDWRKYVREKYYSTKNEREKVYFREG